MGGTFIACGKLFHRHGGGQTVQLCGRLRKSKKTTMENNNTESIDVSLIDDPAIAMRGAFDVVKLNELIDSIRQNGLMQPLVVRRKGERYEVIAAHRRLAACGYLRIGQVPCMVRDADDRKTAVLRMHENLVRDEVNPVEEALFIARTITEAGYTTETMANAIGRGIKYIEDRLEIAAMPEYLQQYLKEKRISLGVALALNKVSDENIKRRWVDSAVFDGMTIKVAERAVLEFNDIEARRAATPDGETPPALPVEVPTILFP